MRLLRGTFRMVNGFRGRRGRPRQRLLPAMERSRRRERRFKAAIVALTGLVVIGLLAGTPIGRYTSTYQARRLRWAVLGVLGRGPGREEIDADVEARRQRGIEETWRSYRAFFEGDTSPGLRRILRAAKMAPDEVLLRWANVDWTVILSPMVFQADDAGRAYRMRPGTRSFWLEDHTLTRGLISFFFLPDTPEVHAAVTEAGASIMPESYQTTNSWGCRGPEPDPDAAHRILVLGDSFMQGLFVLDDETPPEQLRHCLEAAWDGPVSVLNTGHIGYSPEQYYHTLREYHDRFRPEFVVLCVSPNDFGDALSVLYGRGDWSEATYWLGEIRQFCYSRQTSCLLTAAPIELQILDARREAYYPGRVANLWEQIGFSYLNLVDPFIDEHLRSMAEAIERGHRPQHSPLFNGHLHDAHFSRRGAALWGQVVAQRLVHLHDFRKAGDEERRRLKSKRAR